MIRPRKDQVLIKPDEPQSRVSEHGIISTEDTEKETKAVGTVVSFGPDVHDDLKADMKVIYGKFAGEEIRFEDTPKNEVDYILVSDEWVLGAIEE